VHVLLLHEPAAAERLAGELRGAGYDVSIDTHDGGWTWIVRAAETAPGGASEGAAARLADLAAGYGAEYEGVLPP
jgi:hypothetical protein